MQRNEIRPLNSILFTVQKCWRRSFCLRVSGVTRNIVEFSWVESSWVLPRRKHGKMGKRIPLAEGGNQMANFSFLQQLFFYCWTKVVTFVLVVLVLFFSFADYSCCYCKDTFSCHIIIWNAAGNCQNWFYSTFKGYGIECCFTNHFLFFEL